MNRPFRVILLIESSRAYGRGCLLGIGAYIRNHGPWEVLHLERGIADDLPDVVRQWKGDGILTRIENRSLVRLVERLKVPVVDLRGSHCPTGGVMLDTDPDACARLAADHFLDHGFSHFAFCGYPGVDFSDQRSDYFVRYLTAVGHDVQIFAPAGRVATTSDKVQVREAYGELAQPELVAWLQSLPRPVAVFACNDNRGRQLLAACARAGLAVPDDVAVLGVDNDEVICNLSNPPLSSIEPDTYRLGYEGASILDIMMSGDPAPDRSLLAPPKGISVRLSSDVLAMEDAEMAMAVRMIRDRACQGITVEQLVAALTISRATLERRFLRLLGHSPKAEIDRVRFERAKHLLAETTYKLERIALLIGFSNAAQFATAFKRYAGCRPSEYRAQCG